MELPTVAKFSRKFEGFFVVFLFLLLFLEGFAVYQLLILDKYGMGYFTFGASVLKALLFTHVIQYGEEHGIGRKHEQRPLIVSVLYKAVVFGLLAALFHIPEEAVRRFLFGEPSLLRSLHWPTRPEIDDVLARALVFLGAFIPFFAVRELGRLMGERKLFDLFFRPRLPSDLGFPGPGNSGN